MYLGTHWMESVKVKLKATSLAYLGNSSQELALILFGPLGQPLLPPGPKHPLATPSKTHIGTVGPPRLFICIFGLGTKVPMHFQEQNNHVTIQRSSWCA